MFESGFCTAVLGSGAGYPSSLRPTSRSRLLSAPPEVKFYSPVIRVTPIAITKTYTPLLALLN